MEKKILNDLTLLEYFKSENEEVLHGIVQKRKDKNKEDKQKILIDKKEKGKLVL